MQYLSDIQIAQRTTLRPIGEVARELNINQDDIEYYGKYKAKINTQNINYNKQGKLILVTAITPTPAGEGKTTTTIGLADAMRKIGKNVAVALREPSLGPVFGVKGGATGGGYAQVAPMEDINLHFTGDFHAIGAANNLLCAMLDNHIFQGNALGIDASTITFKRCVDMNDRQLRVIQDGLGGEKNGVPRSDGYDITVASEVMAVLCLAKDIYDLKKRLGDIIVAKDTCGKDITARDLKADGAMTVLLKDAIKPNLVQTLEGTPAIIHGGPFANIAHGCNSIIATKTSMALADYTITEAGFGADLGAEKFLDIKCRVAGLKPNAVVIVATVRALKMHGGVDKSDLATPNIEALEQGLPNLLRHINNIKNVYHLPVVVAVNKFPTDSEEEVTTLRDSCKKLGVNVCISDVWAQGGNGGIDLAREVIALADSESNFEYCYTDNMSLKDKINAITTRIYGGDKVEYSEIAEMKLKDLEAQGLGSLPICMAKTQYSFSDNAKLLGAPTNFGITVRDVKLCAGARFVVVYLGAILTMPGLPLHPAAEQIDIDAKGNTVGLF